MKLITKKIDPHGEGFIKLIPQEPEDMWHAYNLIVKGDVLEATTFRKVMKVTSTGSTSSDKVKMNMYLLVEVIIHLLIIFQHLFSIFCDIIHTNSSHIIHKIHILFIFTYLIFIIEWITFIKTLFYTQKILFDAKSSTIRISGRNRTECAEIKIDARHTIELDLNRAFSIHKKYWDPIALERVRDACDPSKTADVAAVVMEPGLAHICLITETMTIVKSKIEKTIPKKRKDFGIQSGHDKALETFFGMVRDGLLKSIDFNVVKCVILASSGFIKDSFYDFMFKKSLDTNKVLIENKSKFLLIHSSSGHMISLREILDDPAAQAKIADSKAAGEAKVLQEFFDVMKENPDRAVYGVRHVEVAHEQGAIKELLLLDALFRSPDIELRKKYVAFVESVKRSGAKVFIFSSLHPSGQRKYTQE